MKQRRYRTRVPGIYYRLTDESNPDSQRRYIVWFEDALGKGRTKTLPLGSTLEDAKNELAGLRARKARGERIVPTRKWVGALLDEWLDSRRDSLSPATVEVYELGIKHTKKEIGTLRVSELRPQVIFKFRAQLQGKGLKTWSVKKYETPLKGALQMAVREGWIAKNPYADALPHERHKSDTEEKRCLSKDEIRLLLKRGTSSSERWRTLFALLVLSGLRISEALSLEWSDVDFGSKLLHVRGERAGARKTTATKRSVMLCDALSARLRAWKLKQDPGHSFVFATATGLPVSRRQALRALRAAEKKAGLPRYTLHELRHTFASILIAQGELPTLIAQQMGHKNAKVTLETYAHLFEAQDSIDKARERLQAAFGGIA